jgi:uncharacterized protein YbjT (DUF2867 family)
MTTRTLVVGATGRVGGQVVRQLLAKGLVVRALTRRPENAELPREAEIIGGDLTSPESFDPALAGVDAVFLVWTAPPTTVVEIIRRIAAPARRLVFLSSPYQTPHPFFQQPNPLARLHASIERAIAESGIPATILRPGMFASNAELWWAPQTRSGDVVRWPYAGAVSAPIDERDIAAIAVHALQDETRESRDYMITGPASLTHAEQVAIIGDVLGRPLRYEELSPDEFRRSAGGSVPPAAADMLLAAWAASVGLPAYMTSTVGEITGRPARSFREWASHRADRFRATEA